MTHVDAFTIAILLGLLALLLLGVGGGSVAK